MTTPEAVQLPHEWFGYYDSPEQTAPAYDPGDTAPCLICAEPWTSDTVRTVSLMVPGAERSWFYRVHRSCADDETPEAATDRESVYVAWMVQEDSADRYCHACDLDRHICPGCGDTVDHGVVACAKCEATYGEETAP